MKDKNFSFMFLVFFKETMSKHDGLVPSSSPFDVQVMDESGSWYSICEEKTCSLPKW